MVLDDQQIKQGNMGSMHSHGTQRRMIPKGSNSFTIDLQTQLCWDHHPIVCYTPHPAPKKTNKQHQMQVYTHTHNIFQGGIHRQMGARRWGGI
jgi:hypothetical protein